MATLTLPMCAPSLWTGAVRNADRGGPRRCVRWGLLARFGRRVRGVLRGRIGGPGGAALVVDELGQPADLAVHRVQAVSLQLEGVAVEAFAGAAERGAQALPLPLDGAPATLEDPQPGVGGGVPEEGQPDAEQAAVVVGLGTGLAHQLVEAFLALGGDRVDHLAAAAGQRRGGGPPQRPLLRGRRPGGGRRGATP